jgi:signal transduction histidine kinase
LAQLFDRFFRGDRARRDDEGHLGLGLSLCKELITRMGGSIHADSREGRFALTIHLPRVEQALEAAS